MSTHDQHDETARQLTSALNQEADTVSTDPTALQRIQRRTSAEGAANRQRWFLGALAAATATAAVIAAVVVIGDQGSPDPSTPAASDPPPTQSSQATAKEVTVPVVYLGLDAKALYTEHHTVVTDKPPVIAALDEFLANQPLDPDYTSGWPSGLDAVGVMQSNHTVSVELEGPPDTAFAPRPDLGDRGGELAVEALFRTAGLTPGGRGTLVYNGDQVRTVLGVDLPAAGHPDADVRAYVSIDNIAEGQTVSSPVTVKVSGNVFEGTVNWQLLGADGRKIDDGFVTTSMGLWTQTDVELGDLEPGGYTFTALEYSAADGKPINVDDKAFTVE